METQREALEKEWKRERQRERERLAGRQVRERPTTAEEEETEEPSDPKTCERIHVRERREVQNKKKKTTK